MIKAVKNILRSSAMPAGLLLLAVCSVVQKPARPDLSRTPTLYAVAYAHLDTQWRWSYPTTIANYLPRTMRQNFALFRRYPHYIFNFSGANRYRMLKEYFPREYEKMKKYVAAGRWFPSGSSMEECDVSIPAAESVIRQILYGGRFFRNEFGKNSSEFMLPDSFGFPAYLPSILAHCGIKGFSTQRLYWGSSAPVGGPGSPQRTPVGIPFNVGFWEGLDGSGVIAAFNPGRDTGAIWYDLSRSPAPADVAPVTGSGKADWPLRIQRNGATGGLFADYMYYGTGDHGGAPDEASIKLLEAILSRSITKLPPSPKQYSGGRPSSSGQIRVGTGPLRVESATAEQMFLDIRPEQVACLPRYKGELQLSNQSTGSLTSQAYVKRWNRRNEVLADAAEKASVAAEWLGGQTIVLPPGNFGRLFLLTAADQDQRTKFKIGGESRDLVIQNWNGFIGQWDNRLWRFQAGKIVMKVKKASVTHDRVSIKSGQTSRPLPIFSGLVPGYIKGSSVAWFASHHHTVDGANVPYAFSYLFAYELKVPPGGTTLTLPDNRKIRILAITAVDRDLTLRPVQPLIDSLPGAEPGELHSGD